MLRYPAASPSRERADIKYHRRVITRRRAALALILPISISAISGCVLRGDYHLSIHDARAVQQLPPEQREGIAIRATRVREHKDVYVRARYLDIVDIPRNPLAPARGHAEAPSAEVAAGAILTCVGSVISVVGTVGWLVLRNGAHGDAALGFGVTALVAEPLMIVGTILWIHGLVRPAQEVRLREGKLQIEPSGLIRF